MDISMNVLKRLEKEQEKHETKIRRAVISYLEEEMMFIQVNENDKTFYVEHPYYVSIPNYVWFWIHKWMNKHGYKNFFYNKDYKVYTV